ncbi:MAG: hypothetical protein ACLP8S_11910 [Solirubrobacteraceae bacterium]
MMRRFAMIAISLAVAGLPAAALAAARSSQSSGGARAELTGFLCQTAQDPPARVVSVTAVMRPLADTQKLAIEFRLFEKASGATAWTLVSDPVADPHLNIWLSPGIPTLGQRPGDVWNVPFPVAQLAAPAAYRFRVRFKWTGGRGRVLGTAALVSATCRQPELRPDLTVDSVSVNQNQLHPRVEDFAVVIGDLGVTGAGPFMVQLGYTHDQIAAAKEQTVAHIAPHKTRALQFAGLLCDAGSEVTVIADPTDQIDVYSRSQASMTVTCPAPTIPVTSSTVSSSA